MSRSECGQVQLGARLARGTGSVFGPEGGQGMGERMIAYCGITCTNCDAYKAMQAGDMEALERMAKKTSEDFGLELTPADAMCDGCLMRGGGTQTPFRRNGVCVPGFTRSISSGRP